MKGVSGSRAGVRARPAGERCPGTPLVRPSRPGGLPGSSRWPPQIEGDGRRFRARVSGARIDLAREESGEADITFVTDPRTFTDLLTGRRGLTEALRSGALGLHGDQTVAERFLQLFSPPEPAQVEPAQVEPAELVGTTEPENVDEARSGH